jgi:polynucleotide 5'-hydroxyl-kinase GRC3/NOL9
MADLYQPNRDWDNLARTVVQPRQIALVIGATDVGKSTFCRFLIERGVTSGLRVGFVDADVGQSQIGPPTTIGLKVFAPNDSTVSAVPSIPLAELEEIDGEPDALYFVGWTSPERHLLQCVAGTRLMVDAALKTEANFIVVDTTGYIEGDTAVVLKQHKIELVKPTHLICLHRSRELDAIVAPFEGDDTIQTHRLLPHRRVTSKSDDFRRKYRESSFARYFSDCVQEMLPFDQIRGQRTPFFNGRQANPKEQEILSDFVDDRVFYAEWGHRSLVLVTLDALPSLIQARLKNHLSLKNLVVETPQYFERCLVGLLDASGTTMSIGGIDAVDFNTKQLEIRCKVGTAAKTKTIQFGRYRM